MKKKNISRHVPQRTCVVCRQVRPKRELTRLVRISSGSVEIDMSGKIPGRGAYLCRDPRCWESGLGGRGLEYNLRTVITQENWKRLMEQSRNFWEELQADGKSE